MPLRPDVTLELLNARSAGRLPDLFGLKVVAIAEGELRMQMPIREELLAPNGYLHAASVIAVADTACGFATIAHLPQGAETFTTIELKSNFLGTSRSGTVEALARAVHIGRNTQVWDATVRDLASGKAIALFRCSQMVLWPRATATRG